MASFYDALSGNTVEMVDWLDKTGSRERGRQARHNAASNTPGNSTNNRPGLGTPYVVGSYSQRKATGVTDGVTNILDQGDNADLLSPGS